MTIIVRIAYVTYGTTLQINNVLTLFSRQPFGLPILLTFSRSGSRNFHMGRPVKGPSKFWVGQREWCTWAEFRLDRPGTSLGSPRPTRPNS